MLPHIEHYDPEGHVGPRTLPDVLRHLSQEPFGGDRFAALSALGLIEMSDSDPTILSIIQNAAAIRPLTNMEAAGIGTMHAVNYLHFKHLSNYAYPYDLHLDSPGAWADRYRWISQQHAEEFSKLMHTRHIQTNIYNRAAIWPHFLERMFGDRQVSIIDLGASTNQTLGRVMCNGKCDDIAPFNLSFDASTEWPEGSRDEIMCAMHKPLNIVHGLGVDLNDPFKSEADWLWYLSCRHPQHATLEDVKQTQLLAHYLRNQSNLEFQEADIATMSMPDGYDLAIASTVMYQLTERQKHDVVASTLRDIPYLLLNEYARVVGNTVVFDSTRQPGAYRSILLRRGEDPLELMQYHSSLCNSASPGKDYGRFLAEYTQKTCTI